MYDILQLNDMLVPELLDIADQLKIFLNKCEILDPIDFIRHSSNLRYALSESSFHLTLGRTKGEIKDLPKLATKFVIKLNLPALRNVSV